MAKDEREDTKAHKSRVDAEFSEWYSAYLHREIAMTPEEKWQREARAAEFDEKCKAFDPLPLPSGSPEEIKSGLADEFMNRVIACRHMGDLIDSWGESPTRPAFIVIQKLKYPGIRTNADEAWIEGRSLRIIDDMPVPVIGHWHSFPLYKFDFDIIRDDSHPELYKALMEKISQGHHHTGEDRRNGPRLPSGKSR